MFSFLHHFAFHTSFFSIRYDSLVDDTHKHKLQDALNKRIQESSSRRGTTRRHQNRAISRRSLLSSVHVKSSTDLLENKTINYDFADSTPPLSICIDSLHWATEHFVQGSKWSLHSRENTSRLQFITSLINATKTPSNNFLASQKSWCSSADDWDATRSTIPELQMHEWLRHVMCERRLARSNIISSNA